MWSHYGGVMYELGHIFLMIQNIRGMETIVLTAFFAHSLSEDSYSQSSMTDEAFGIFWNTTRNRQDHTLNVQCWHCWSGIIASSFHVVLRSSDTPLLHKPTTRTLFAGRAFCCTLLLQSGIHLSMTLSLALHLLYLSPPLWHSYSVRHLGLVGSHDRNLSVSASRVFDIPVSYTHLTLPTIYSV